MRKCRTIELKIENELFLQFCVNYGTPEQEKFRAKYEAADLAQRKSKAKEKVSQARSNEVPDVRTVGLPILRPQAETEIHHDTGGA